jgi:transposase
MSTASSTPMPATGSLQLVEAAMERFDGAPVGERRKRSLVPTFCLSV